MSTYLSDLLLFTIDVVSIAFILGFVSEVMSRRKIDPINILIILGFEAFSLLIAGINGYILIDSGIAFDIASIGLKQYALHAILLIVWLIIFGHLVVTLSETIQSIRHRHRDLYKKLDTP